MITVSVVVPMYNREFTIERCIHSIISQSFKPKEIIVVDDGSTDNSVEIVKRLGVENLRVICQNHKGAQAARNIGILNSDSDYIIFLDSDDEWLPDLLERMINKATESPNYVIYADCYIEEGSKRKQWRLPGDGGEMYAFLLEKPAPTFDALLVKKEFLKEIGYLDENAISYQEWETSIRLAKNHNFIHLKTPLFIYYLHEGETISKNKSKDLNGYYYIVKKHSDEIKRVCGKSVMRQHYRILLKKAINARDRRWLMFLVLYCIYKIS